MRTGNYSATVQYGPNNTKTYSSNDYQNLSAQVQQRVQQSQYANYQKQQYVNNQQGQQVSSTSKPQMTYSQKQALKKSQRDAEYARWLANKREHEERQREIARQREIREEMKRQQRGAEAQQRYLNYAANVQQSLNKLMQVRATEGRDFVYNYQPKGYSPLKSHYTPSNPNANKPSVNEIVGVQKDNGITSFGDKTQYNKTTAWEDSLANAFLRNPVDIDELLRQKFNEQCKCDIIAIMAKLPSERTEEDEQILADYAKFRKDVSEDMARKIEKRMADLENTEEKEVLDHAILAQDSYGNDTTGWIDMTSFRKVELDDLPDEWKPLKRKLDLCNQNGEIGSTGFHAEMYYNEITGNYEIAFRGTHDLKSINQDIDIAEAIFKGEGRVVQYDLTKIIGDEINKMPDELKSKLSVTGHSLGGGQASIIGLVTGVKTSTFNAATIPEAYLKKWGLDEKVKNGDVQNIMAYHSSTDLLTNTQKYIRSEAIGVDRNLGDIVPSSMKESAKTVVGAAIMSSNGAEIIANNYAAYKAIRGDFETAKTVVRGYNVLKTAGDRMTKGVAINAVFTGSTTEGHSMSHITNHFHEKGLQQQAEYDRLRYIRNNFISKGSQQDPLAQNTIWIRQN